MSIRIDCAVNLPLLTFFVAHKEAYEKARLIHRDISAGNILLVRSLESGNWEGMLNDWELAKSISETDDTARQPDRTVCLYNCLYMVVIADMEMIYRARGNSCLYTH